MQATGWTARRSNPGGGRTFPHASRPTLGSTQFPVQWVPVLFPGDKATRAWRWQSTEVKEKVELYLYSPSGPSRPVLGWTLPVKRISGGSEYTVRNVLPACDPVFSIKPNQPFETIHSLHLPHKIFPPHDTPEGSIPQYINPFAPEFSF